MMKKSIACLFLFVTLFFVISEEITGSSSPFPEEKGLSLSTRFGFVYDTENQTAFSSLGGIDFGFDSRAYSLSAKLLIQNDGTYTPEVANLDDNNFLNYYAFLESGGLTWRPDENLTFSFGRLEHRDQLTGPYGLFVSSVAPAAPLIEIRYENSYFFYESRWVELNSRSTMITDAFPDAFPDRGTNIKAYGFKFGDMRFGFQDAAVYVGRSFDFEYLISPIPQYFTQYVKGTEGRPWTDGSNDNDIIGVFWDWNRSGSLSFDAQFLMDDFNMHFLGVGPDNPWKAAWAASTSLTTGIGKFKLSHAGALKYTFARTRDESKDGQEYSYTYYPDTRFMVDSAYRSISIEDMMFGYKNGENNIAFRLDYEGRPYGLDVQSYFEFVLSGSKSPTNAWHGSDDWRDHPGTQLLTDPVLEKRCVLNTSVSRRFGNFILDGTLQLGAVFNALELVKPVPSATADPALLVNTDSWIWTPGAKNTFMYGASLGVRYEIPVMAILNKYPSER